MATSGSRDFEPDVAEYIEEAFERCGLEFRTGYDGVTARRSLNLLFADWANRGLNQWTVTNSTTTLTLGAEFIDLSASTIDVLDVIIRRTEGSTTTDITMQQIGRSEYYNIPTKSTSSTRSTCAVATRSVDSHPRQGGGGLAACVAHWKARRHEGGAAPGLRGRDGGGQSCGEECDRRGSER